MFLLDILESFGERVDLLLLLLDGLLAFLSSSLEVLGRSGEMTFEFLESSSSVSEIGLECFGARSRNQGKRPKESVIQTRRMKVESETHVFLASSTAFV